MTDAAFFTISRSRIIYEKSWLLLKVDKSINNINTLIKCRHFYSFAISLCRVKIFFFFFSEVRKKGGRGE